MLERWSLMVCYTERMRFYDDSELTSRVVVLWRDRCSWSLPVIAWLFAHSVEAEQSHVKHTALRNPYDSVHSRLKWEPNHQSAPDCELLLFVNEQNRFIIDLAEFNEFKATTATWVRFCCFACHICAGKSERKSFVLNLVHRFPAHSTSYDFNLAPMGLISFSVLKFNLYVHAISWPTHIAIFKFAFSINLIKPPHQLNLCRCLVCALHVRTRVDAIHREHMEHYP